MQKDHVGHDYYILGNNYQILIFVEPLLFAGTKYCVCMDASNCHNKLRSLASFPSDRRGDCRTERLIHLPRSHSYWQSWGWSPKPTHSMSCLPSQKSLNPGQAGGGSWVTTPGWELGHCDRQRKERGAWEPQCVEGTLTLSDLATFFQAGRGACEQKH